MTYINVALRRLVTERAGYCCEYCLLAQADNFLPFEIDHIISEKHDGETTSDNLCLSCPSCNAFKGSDIGSLDRQTEQFTPLFNPRTQDWLDHFQLDGAVIVPQTAEGRVTVFLLRMNRAEQIIEREALLELGRYPC